MAINNKLKFLSKKYLERKAYLYKMLDIKKIEKELLMDETISEKEAKFEKKFADLIGVKHAVLFGSGNHALKIGLKHQDWFDNKSEIIIQPFTCKQVPKIISTKFRPVFSDINLNNYNLDLNKAKKKVTKKTKAIYAIYSYGKAINSVELNEFTKKNGIYLIEDCAHSLGAKNGKIAGTSGEFSIFSLRKNLPLNTGGVLCTNNHELHAACIEEKSNLKHRQSALKWFFEKKIFYSKKFFPSLNLPYIFLSKMGHGMDETSMALLDKFELSMAIVSIENLPKIINETRKNANQLINALGKEKFIFTQDAPNEINAFTRIPIYFKQPKMEIERIWFEIQEKGFETGLFYKTDFEKTISNEKERLKFPASIQASNNMLPIGVQGLNKSQVSELADLIKSFSK